MQLYEIGQSVAKRRAELDLTPEPREENASYIATWLEVLKNDSRAIFSAASHAQRAADYLNKFSAPAAPAGDSSPESEAA